MLFTDSGLRKNLGDRSFMYNRTKKNPYTKQTIFDVLSVAAGLAVIGLGVFTLIKPEENSYLFPVVFLLAAIFQCLAAVPRMMGGYGKGSVKKKALGIGLFVVAGIMLLLAAVSAICLWR